MLYPLRFQPLFRRYLWGGRRLESRLGKPLGLGNDYAESWEVVDRDADQSIVIAGPLANSPLRNLCQAYPTELFGRHIQVTRFPLLFKFLDCHRILSVQVHPNDAEAALLNPPDLGKTEAWVVIEAEPGSEIYAGLKAGVSQATLASAIKNGTLATCLHSFSPRVGDCVFIPAGLVHALGAGLLIAEIQQSSDTTFRLFDWDRVDAEGRARELHVDAALACTRYDLGPSNPQVPVIVQSPQREQLVRCDKFVLDRLSIRNSYEVGGDNGFHLLAMLNGAARVENDPAERPLVRGETMLLPASLGKVHLDPIGEAVLLDIYLP